jgi:hypothetical protein
MEQHGSRHFSARDPAQLTVKEVMAKAKAAIADVTDLPVLSVIRTTRSPEGGWVVALELLETAARMGDNDLLTAYEIQFDPFGEVAGISRLARYHREDAPSL